MDVQKVEVVVGLIIEAIFSVMCLESMDMKPKFVGIDLTTIRDIIILSHCHQIIPLLLGSGLSISESICFSSTTYAANVTQYAPNPSQYRPQFAPSQFSSYAPFQQQNAQAYFVGPSTNVPQPRFPNSEASHHVTTNPKMIGNKVDIDGASTVYMGNGQGLPIKSVGSSTFTSPIQPHTSLILKNLLLVTNITKNLLNVSQFARDNHVFFEFHPFHSTL